MMEFSFNINGSIQQSWQKTMVCIDYVEIIEEIKKHTTIKLNDLDIGYDDKENGGVIFLKDEDRSLVAFNTTTGDLITGDKQREKYYRDSRRTKNMGKIENK